MQKIPSSPLLPPAPRKIADANGKPLFGSYEGAVAVVDRSDLKGEFKPRLLDSLIRDKAFTYTAASGMSDEGKRVKVVMAIADLGYASSCFVTVFDLDGKKVLADQSFMAGSASISAEPVEGLQASFTGWAHHARISLSHPRGADHYSQHIDIALLTLPPLRFDFDREHPLEPWRVTSQENSNIAVDLHFQPVGMHANKTNLGIIQSDFVQPSGLWEGTLVDKATGEVYRFSGADGEGEDQHVKW